MDFILTRRSIRKYTDQPVSDEKINYLLKAAMSAPSAGNGQPWHFIVIKDKEKLNKIIDYHQNAKMLTEASVAILVCADLSTNKYEVDYWVQDCAAATQNILLAAHKEGLGGVWLGVYPRKERVKALQKLFNMPEHAVPISLVSLGYPAEEKGPSDRYDTNRVHINTW
ncbi:Nitroreductase [Candidatus Syntrophocurvum alkaliphilum]|uniref:Nitroreductase n=1 Tax=Candidatus Syntrophocurvum alkaliphilum TaxID=2293317 RepID=A0A6I6DC40_9FIRM|nr:nitroreductase family protein [Candidatus Syntrophocurvum alkaliphilum]QGU00239.1 Nitroreductase [Candidatus Syntrophocurvum alkaliphilum]